MAVGEEVLAWDEATGQTGAYRVVATWAHADPATTYLTLDGERLVATPEHPFYTQERGWVAAGLLRVGERVRQADGGWGTVRAVRSEWDAGTRHNLTVDTAHTYAVGGGRWTVHNSCPGGYFKGTDKPWTKGATPNSAYTQFNRNGQPVQTAIYNGDGDVVIHVDWKQHGTAAPGHYHTFPIPGNPGSGHGPGKPHWPPRSNPELDWGFPPGWEIP